MWHGDVCQAGTLVKRFLNRLLGFPCACAKGGWTFEKFFQGTQTEYSGSLSQRFSVYICSLQDGHGWTQISHPVVCDEHTECKPLARSQHAGPNEKCTYFGGYDSVIASPTALKDLCNVNNSAFAFLLSLLPAVSVRACDATLPNRLLLFLMKLKLGISFSSLAVLFSVSKSSASKHFETVLAALTAATKQWIFRPPTFIIQSTLPDCFKVHHPSCTMVLEIAEVKTEQPNGVGEQLTLYSSYKSGHTLKFLVGIIPNGMVCFCSKAYGGRYSNTDVAADSGFFDLVRAGDVILSDKDFPGIRSELEKSRAVMVVPPSFDARSWSAVSDAECTYNTAQVRVHVQRMIQRIKTHHILNTLIPVELIPLMTDVFHMCCVLSNLQLPVVKPRP